MKGSESGGRRLKKGAEEGREMEEKLARIEEDGPRPPGGNEREEHATGRRRVWRNAAALVLRCAAAAARRRTEQAAIAMAFGWLARRQIGRAHV